MLILNSDLTNKSVMSLQTGAKLASLNKAIIDPVDLKIYAFSLTDRFEKKSQNFLLTADIREFGPMGAIVDSSDEFVTKQDVISLDKLIDLNINLIGMQVIDENKRKVGKITDFAVSNTDFFIMQIHVSQGIIKSLSNVGSIIGRNQIIEITDDYLKVKSPDEKLRSSVKIENQVFVNPFATSTPPSE